MLFLHKLIITVLFITFTYTILAMPSYAGWCGTYGIVCEGEGSGGSCFLPQTQILLPDGETKSIEDFKVGEEVMSQNSESGKVEVAKVTQVFRHEGDQVADEYLIVKTNNGKELKVTPNHPVFLKKISIFDTLFVKNKSNGEWREIGEAKVGDELWDVIDGWITISSIELVNKTVPVYNLEVANTHTYFAEGLLVHNKPPGSGSGGSCCEVFGDPAICGQPCGGGGQEVRKWKLVYDDPPEMTAYPG
ncbi:hypothetical protein GYA49_03685, partial [Candidatus Beckwithbacteria bacterium]|nr:hypothetical protein [Candidatus Beckwithbacteria bacterium]